MSRTADLLVAGGGIVGCAIALEAARSGLRVLLAEPRCIGGGATGAGMGHLVAIDDDPHELALCRLSLELSGQQTRQARLNIRSLGARVIGR